MTIQCPNCGHEQDESALFCSECKQQLAPIGGLGTRSIDPAVLEDLATGSLAGRQAGLTAKLEARVSLHILGQDDVIPLVGQEAFILGRISEGQSILPDIDLEAYEAYDSGVSRLHARVDVGGNDISITDLGSSNGTQINGKSLEAHGSQTLNDKDRMRLGRFDIQVLIKE